MFTFIILVAVGIFAVAYFTTLPAVQRRIALAWTFNILTLGIVYLFKGIKGGSKICYQAGRDTAATMAIQSMDTFKSMAETNNDIKSKGGATRIAITKANDHGKVMGMDNIANNLKASADAKVEKLATMTKELEELEAYVASLGK